MAGTPKKTPAKSPMKAKSPSPMKAKSPMKSAKKSPVKSAKKSPVKSPAKTPKKTPKKTPSKSPKLQKAIQKSPAGQRSGKKSPAEKKARKAKKIKDENAPKRGSSAYMIWLNTNRADIIKQHGLDSSKVAEIAKKGGEVWKTMSEEQKKPYNDLAAKDRARYEKEKEGYVPDPEVAAANAAAKGKKAKKEKDPDAPKKAATGYILYINANRAKILKDFKLEKITEVAKKAGELWGSMSEAEKKPYMDGAAKDKVRYDQEMAAYTAAA